jgi:hypothetical protein
MTHHPPAGHDPAAMPDVNRTPSEDGPHALYCIRINGRLGATALSAFPAMVHHVDARETVLTGLLEDRSAVFGVIAQIEALGLELIEVRRIR